jgi:hypothetical protein
LSPGSFTCPSGQKLVLAAVSYTNIVLTDTNNSLTDNLGSVSRTQVDRLCTAARAALHEHGRSPG